jgi:hypothetical protein
VGTGSVLAQTVMEYAAMTPEAKAGDCRVYAVDPDHRYVVRLFVMLISAFACGIAAGYFWGVWK